MPGVRQQHRTANISRASRNPCKFYLQVAPDAGCLAVMLWLAAVGSAVAVGGRRSLRVAAPPLAPWPPLLPLPLPGRVAGILLKHRPRGCRRHRFRRGCQMLLQQANTSAPAHHKVTKPTSPLQLGTLNVSNLWRALNIPVRTLRG